MLRAPGFWQRDGLLAGLLSPLSAIGTSLTARRVARSGWRASVPVLCCGNVTIGGAGKTTVVLDLARRLQASGVRPHILLRGYGGRVRGPHRVEPDETAAEVGDEALLLAAVAPTWTGADRAASARAAVAAGAEVLVMDDGLQNSGLMKDMSLLIVDGATGFGNGRVLPAGPLREPIMAAAGRCKAAVMIGEDQADAGRHLSPLPILHARLVQDAAISALRGKRILAFAGIARPSKFFRPLAEAGAILATSQPFADHHPYTPRDLERLAARSEALNATLVTTPKDAVRLPPAFRVRVTVIGVGLEWAEPEALDALLARLLARKDGAAKERL